MKAGLCDPGRPYGVFLFVGPTGNREDRAGPRPRRRAVRLARADGPDRHERAEETRTASSASSAPATRAEESRSHRASASQPFSVVLLDEFEKAAPQLWDLFLQVFDAGRLSDRSGQTVDFRQTIVIVTSNLGSAIETRQALGFSEGGTSSFSSERVERAVRDVLRPELINRFDRVIVFRPLARTVMRGIVHKEVQAALQPPGPGRSRLGDRDRRVGRRLPARQRVHARSRRPSAATGGRAPPAGSARSRDRDAGGAPRRAVPVRLVRDGSARRPLRRGRRAGRAERRAAPPVTNALSARDVAREGRGRRADLRILRDTLSTLRELVAEPHWQERKSAALAATSSPGLLGSGRSLRRARGGRDDGPDRGPAPQQRLAARSVLRAGSRRGRRHQSRSPSRVSRASSSSSTGRCRRSRPGRAQDALVRVEPGETTARVRGRASAPCTRRGRGDGARRRR